MEKYIGSSLYLVLFSLLFIGCRREEDVLSATYEDAFRYKDYKIYSDPSSFVCGKEEGYIEIEENIDKALCVAKIKGIENNKSCSLVDESLPFVISQDCLLKTKAALNYESEDTYEVKIRFVISVKEKDYIIDHDLLVKVIDINDLPEIISLRSIEGSQKTSTKGDKRELKLFLTKEQLLSKFTSIRCKDEDKNNDTKINLVISGEDAKFIAPDTCSTDDSPSHALRLSDEFSFEEMNKLSFTLAAVDSKGSKSGEINVFLNIIKRKPSSLDDAYNFQVVQQEKSLIDDSRLFSQNGSSTIICQNEFNDDGSWNYNDTELKKYSTASKNIYAVDQRSSSFIYKIKLLSEDGSDLPEVIDCSRGLKTIDNKICFKNYSIPCEIDFKNQKDLLKNIQQLYIYYGLEEKDVTFSELLNQHYLKNIPFDVKAIEVISIPEHMLLEQ
jgi:hypothetical protein